MLTKRLLTVLLACLAAVVLPASAKATGWAGAAPAGRVVVIGVPGLQWDDLDPVRTPNLWGLAAKGGSASMSTRTIPPEGRSLNCPIAGWLTVSAGQRAGVPASLGTSGTGGAPQAPAAPAAPTGSVGNAPCEAPPVPIMAADGSGSATVPAWAELVAYQQASPYRAQIGLLGATIAAAGGKIAAIGPGAALAAADRSGKIQKYVPSVTDLPDLTPYTAVFAEADQIAKEWSAVGGEELPVDVRQSAVAAADQTVGAVLSHVAPEATVLVAGLSDAAVTAHLHVAIATGPTGPASDHVRHGTSTGVENAETGNTETGNTETRNTGAGSTTEGARTGEYRRGWLTATSTRQDALVTITDLTATITNALGLATPKDVVGKPWLNGGEAPADPHEAVAELADADMASQVLRQVREPFFITLVTLQLLFYGLAAIVVRRHRRMQGPALASIRVVAVLSGALPISAFLAQLVPWWSFVHPMSGLVGTILAFSGLIAGLAFAGPWRGHVLGPLTVVAGVSSLALLVDVLTGSTLQVNAVSGYEPVTGGRFYGFGNMAFAVFATGTILLLAGVAHLLRHRRWIAVAGCLGYGLLATLADGLPGWGADFGGVPPFVVGVAVFLLLLTGRRVSAARLALIGLAGAALIGLIAVADWLRPADERTHLGAFVQQVIGGEGGSVVERKLGAMLGTLGNWQLTLLSLTALAFLLLVLFRPSRWGASALTQAYGRAPELRAGLLGALIAALVGFLINDSGIAIPAMALTVAVPLTLDASVRALQLSAAQSGPHDPAGRSSAPAGSTAPPAT